MPAVHATAGQKIYRHILPVIKPQGTASVVMQPPMDNYGAVYIGDEEHKNEKCGTCHVSNIHEITGLHMTPSVKKISISKENNTNMLRASVSAGYKMKVRGARYYIDTPLEKFGMYPGRWGF